MSIIAGITAGAGLASSLFGGYKAGKERKKMAGQIKGWEADNKAFYNSRALGDYTQRSDAQNVLRQMREQLDRQTKRATNTQAITGGTVEQTAAAKDSANKALADATSNIAAVGQQYKDKVTDQYLNRKNQLGIMQYQNTAGKAASYENLMQSGLNTAAGALGTLATGAGKGGGVRRGNPGNISNPGVKPIASANPIKDVSGVKIVHPSPLTNPLR